MFFAALFYFVAEIAAFIAVGDNIGFGWAILLLLVVSALGPFIVKRVGLAILADTQRRLGAGEVPTRELLDGVVVLAGGFLICVPGFIGDAIGLLLMIGPVRHLAIRLAGHRMARRVQHIRPTRWGAIDVVSEPVAGPGSSSPRPPRGVFGPGGPGPV